MGFPTTKKPFTRSVTNNKRHYCKFWYRRKTDGGGSAGGGGSRGDEAVKLMRRNTSFDSILSRQSLLNHSPNIEPPSIISLSSSPLSSLPNEDLLKIEELNGVSFEKEEQDNRICHSPNDEGEGDESQEEIMKISRSPSFKVYVTQQHDINDDKKISTSNSKEDNTKMGELKNEESTTSVEVESTNNTPNKTNSIWSRLRGIMPKNKNIGMKSMLEAAVGCYTSNTNDNSNGSISGSDVVFHKKKLSPERTTDDKPKD